MTSFSQKYAVDRGLPDKKEETEKLGKLLEKVLRLYGFIIKELNFEFFSIFGLIP